MTQQSSATTHVQKNESAQASPAGGAEEKDIGTIIVDLTNIVDGKSADGVDADVIQVKATLARSFGWVDSGIPVPGAALTLKVEGGPDNPASDVKLYQDQACTIPIDNQHWLTLNNSDATGYVYAVCTAHADRSYVVKVDDCNAAWYGYVNGSRSPDGAPLNFKQSNVVPTGQLILQATNQVSNQPLMTCTVGSKTTGIDILVQLSNSPYSAHGPFQGSLKPKGGSGNAGAVQFDTPYTDGAGHIMARVFPTQQGDLTLTLTDTSTNNTGTLDFKAIVLKDPVQISANPNPITGPVDRVVFTASFTDINNTPNPPGVLLQWSGADQFTQGKLPPPQITKTTNDPSSRQIQAGPIIEDDFINYPNGGLNAKLSLYGTTDALTFTQPDWFDSNITGLVAPYIDIGDTENGITYITDSDYENIDTTYVTFYIPSAADPLSNGQSVIKLYMHTAGGTELDPDNDPPLGTKNWGTQYLGHDLPVKVDLNTGIFDVNQTVLIYYVMKNGPVGNTSQPLEIVVNRQDLSDNTPDPKLQPPSGIPHNYYYKDSYDAHKSWGVRIRFNASTPPQAGDTILVRLKTYGMTIDNQNVEHSPNPILYIVQPDDVKQSPVEIDLPGFTYDQLANIDYSWGNLYYEYTNKAKNKTSTSPQRPVTVDTVSPHTDSRFWRVRFPSSKF
ncbi:hypothetical protein CAL14_17715 [Bordetella genomosp. 9]|uniref:hypothetical protein n=1 Tax=Bordetella genomosp. 9 TaxID=1416803 RepID=UPI000A2902D7|nr:hypothetical protein [Bordetella genomosp. 9]ARP91895.1 hypothetical protein CAL14_17715 [Bordetella genomosp. 9]